MAKQIVPPILVVFVGIAWLLNVMNVWAGVNWLWPVGIASAGIVALTFGGVNRVTVVLCPFLITGSIFSVMYQTKHLTTDQAVPLLTIALGVYWLIASLLKVPMPQTFLWEDDADDH